MKIKKIKENKIPIFNQAEDTGKIDWLMEGLGEGEGELSVDVFHDDKNLYLISTIAGVKPENLEISLNNDLLTIRGCRRQEQSIDEKDYFCQECYWGAFSRSIILPVEVKPDKITATLTNGVLKIILPKAERRCSIPIKIKET